jgi:hypothetical protein
MTVFSEKVQPTFTNSDLNVIIVEDFNEIFFDVFELEINGNKFVAEKVSEKNGKPIVSIPLTHNNQKKNALFLLEKGEKTEIFYNESNNRSTRPVRETKIEKLDILNLVETKIQEKVPLFEVPDVEKTVDNIKAIKKSAVQYLNKCREEYVRSQKIEISNFESKKKQEIKKLNEEYRKNMVSEFLSLTENVKNQILESNFDERSNYNDYIRELFVEYCQEIEGRVDNNYETAINSLESKINTLTETIFADKIEKIFENRVNEIEGIILANDSLTNKKVDEKISKIDSWINSKIDDFSKKNIKNLENLVERYDNALLTLEKSSVETNNNVLKSTNRALSRIGNVKTELLEKIDKVNLDVNTLSDIQVNLRENINTHKESIKKYFNTKISDLNTKITDVNEEYKSEVVSLIRESERKLLEEISGIDTKLPTLILKEARTKKDNVEVSLEDIRKELENNISGRFTKEIVSLKRLIEMTSGGGGGSSSGGGITVETDPVFTTWAQANSANYESTYNTVSVNSASWGNTSNPLTSGGVIDGNLTVTGNISGENIYSNNITSLENKLEAVYSYLIQNFENTYIATSITINDFVSYEWSEGLNLRPGDILLLSGANIAYILGESDGSGLNDYYQVNLKPNFIFFKANLSNYSTIDTFPLSSMKSSKYIIQVEDIVNNDIFYCELNVISNGVIATVTEYGSNYSTNEPFVEFGAETDGIILSLSATGLGRDMSNFIIKGNRTNIF